MPFISISKNITVSSENILSISYDEDRTVIIISFKTPIYYTGTDISYQRIILDDFISEEQARNRIKIFLAQIQE